MSHSRDFEAEFNTAVDIIGRALQGAVDDAADANISGHSLTVALSQTCRRLLEIFGHSTDQIGSLAHISTAAHSATRARH
jgi:hypothetical protein